MDGKCGRFAMLAAAAVVSSPMPVAAAEETRVLAPSTRWQLDYGEVRCRLARVFGEGDDEIALMFDQFYPSDRFTMTMAGNRVRRLGSSGMVKMRFGPGETESREVTPQRAEFPEFGRALIFSRLAPGQPEYVEEDPDEVSGDPEPLAIDIERAATVEWIDVGTRSQSIALELGGFGDAMAALNLCSQDLLQHWGVDAERHLTMTRRARPTNFGEVADAVARFYPLRAARSGEEADLLLRVMVDAGGAITSCHVAEMTSTEYIRTEACKHFEKRAEFEPALDAAGQPIDSNFVTSIIFRIR